MTFSKNMNFDTPPLSFRRPGYGEHYCLIFTKTGEYVGALYLNSHMRKVWRNNKFAVVITDV